MDHFRDLAVFYVVGDRVFTIPSAISPLRPMDEIELGDGPARWLQSERLGWTALDEHTCMICKAFMPVRGDFCVCDECRPAYIEQLRELTRGAA